MTRIIEMWCDSVTAVHEIGIASSTILYASLEDLLERHPEVENSVDYAPVKVTVTIPEEVENVEVD